MGMVADGDGGEGDVLASTSSAAGKMLGLVMLGFLEEDAIDCWCCSWRGFGVGCTVVVVVFFFVSILVRTFRQLRHQRELPVGLVGSRQWRRGLSPILCRRIDIVGSGRWTAYLDRLRLASLLVQSSGSSGATFRLGLGSARTLFHLHRASLGSGCGLDGNLRRGIHDDTEVGATDSSRHPVNKAQQTYVRV